MAILSTIHRQPHDAGEDPERPAYDGFLGSGNSLAAAELTERFCYGMELDPPLGRRAEYVPVI